MSALKVSALAYARLKAPDLDQAERFLVDFGLVRAARTRDAVFMRGTDPGSYNHVVELGEPSFVGAAFTVDDLAELERASALPGASGIDVNAEPGGGSIVRLTDPNGFTIELLHGIEQLPAIPVEHLAVNTAAERLRRAGTFYRRKPGPSQVKRIGHFVISTPEVTKTRDWYRETLGLIGTDDVFAGSQDHIVASFNRIERGGEYVDHHVFMTHEAPKAGLNHLGFEVQDFDDMLFGNQHLRKAEADHRWGIGRHLLGSQVYNQWSDPWGRGYEHWTDTDVLTADHPLTLLPAAEALTSQWGDPPPARLMKKE